MVLVLAQVQANRGKNIGNHYKTHCQNDSKQARKLETRRLQCTVWKQGLVCNYTVPSAIKVLYAASKYTMEKFSLDYSCIILTLLQSSFSFYLPLTIKKEEVYNCKQLFIYFWSGIFTFNNRKMHTFDVNFGLSQSS